jgi:nitroreductase
VSRCPERALQLELVEEAGRAPSVHNIQPARWRFVPESEELLLYRAKERVLPVADPTCRDVRTSLGAAFEGMALALSRRGLGLGAPELARRSEATTTAGCEATTTASCDLVARARLCSGVATDPLEAWVATRRAFRGRFEPATAAELETLRSRCTPAADVRLVYERRAIEELARSYERASYDFLSEPAYLREFYGWCRFSPAHPAWGRDGLNADCMALSGLERRAAALFLRPAPFAVLRNLGLARVLVSEAAQIRSSSALLLFCPPYAADRFDSGRRFYRLWLEITAAGFRLCPLSALTDDPREARVLASAHSLPPGHMLVNVFRLGPVRGTPAARSARLPAGELLV